MKVGSIVECVDNVRLFDFIVPLKLNTPYTVREIIERPSGVGILLEEITNIIWDGDQREWAYRIERFRELLPPMEIQKELDECTPILIEI